MSKEAFKSDPDYIQTSGLPRHFCFGFVNGHLLLGNKHHQQIMAKLINSGWTWDDLMNAPQAWGWGHYMYGGTSGDYMYTTYTSDAGFQNEKEIKRANAAIAQLYRLPVRDSGDREEIFDSKEYGSGLEGKDFVKHYNEGGQLQSLLDKVQGPVPPPPAKTAVAFDPTYWEKAELPSDFCFGFVGGHLFLGKKHHQQIIAKLIEQGWNWEDLMNAQQAWGWGEVERSWDYSGGVGKASGLRVAFTSDAGFQNEKAVERAKGALAQLYHLPVRGGSFATGIDEEDEFGSGLKGKENVNNYLSEGTYLNKRLKEVQGPVPFPAPPGKEQAESDYWTCPNCGNTNVYQLGVGPHDRASIGPLYCPNCGWRSDKKSKLAMPMNPPKGMTINTRSEYAGSGESHIIFEAVVNGNVVGELTIATRMSHEYYDDEYYIGGIEVDPDYRRRGIATLLLQDAEKKLGPIAHDWNAMTPEGNEWAEAVTSSVKEAVVYDPKYWKEHHLPSDGCFGWINGKLMLGSEHHQQIMAKLISSGWTWEDLMNAQQAWGWYSVTGDYSGHPKMSVRFTSDAGFQNDKAMLLTKGAFAQMYHMPVEDEFHGDYIKQVKNPEQYGSGISGKDNINYHLKDLDTLNEEVTGEVPQAPPAKPEEPKPEIGPGSSYVDVPGGGSPPPKKTIPINSNIPEVGTKFSVDYLENQMFTVTHVDPEQGDMTITSTNGMTWLITFQQWHDEWLPHTQIKIATVQKKSAWTDLMDKATRLRQSGGVQIIRNDPDHVVAQVKSGIDDDEKDPDKPDYYTTEIWRDDPDSNAITMWNCDCQWSDYSWGRTRQWKKYEGRPCTHTLATFWEGQVKKPGDTSAPPATPPTPLPGGAMLQNQGLITPVLPPQPGQSPIPGMPPPEQAPPQPEPAPTPAPAPPAQSTLRTPNDAAKGTLNFPGAFSSVWKESDAGFSLKMTQPKQYKYGYNPTTGLQVWETHPVTGDPHHFEVLGEGHEKYPSGRIYYYGPNDIFHMVWANRGLFSAKQKARKEVENWVRQNLNGNVTYTGEENDEALKSSSWKEAQGVDGEASTGADGISSATPSTPTQEPLYESSYHALRYMPHHRLWHLVSMSYPWVHEKTMRGHAARRVHKEWHRRTRKHGAVKEFDAKSWGHQYGHKPFFYHYPTDTLYTTNGPAHHKDLIAEGTLLKDTDGNNLIAGDYEGPGKAFLYPFVETTDSSSSYEDYDKARAAVNEHFGEDPWVSTGFGYKDYDTWRYHTGAGLPGETPLFGNGDLVRARTPLVGTEPQSGQEMNVPQNSAGEVLDANDDEAWVIFPLNSGPLGPHLVKVRCHPEEIYLDPKAQPFIWKKHHGSLSARRWIHDARTGEVYIGGDNEHHEDILKRVPISYDGPGHGWANPGISAGYLYDVPYLGGRRIFDAYLGAPKEQVYNDVYNKLADEGLIDPLVSPRQKELAVATQ
jgi:GNAT superfamily N-acetyltransferase/predicted RNA-binding Zn-ribbon protein involved in translation (DUF1610 family)